MRWRRVVLSLEWWYSKAVAAAVVVARKNVEEDTNHDISVVWLLLLLLLKVDNFILSGCRTNQQSKCGERRCSGRGQHQDTTKGDCDNSKNHKLLSFRVVVASEAMLRFGLEGRTVNEARRTRSTGLLLLLLLFKSTFHDIQHSIRFKFSYGWIYVRISYDVRTYVLE